MRGFEPQLAADGELCYMAGWGNKLAGAIVRISGILHMAEWASCPQLNWNAPIECECVENAIHLAQEYLLPHAEATFGLMGVDEKIDKAQQAWQSIAKRLSLVEEQNSTTKISRRDIHQWNRRLLPKMDEVDEIIGVLIDCHYLRPIRREGEASGRGKKSPTFEVNPVALECELLSMRK